MYIENKDNNNTLDLLKSYGKKIVEEAYTENKSVSWNFADFIDYAVSQNPEILNKPINTAFILAYGEADQPRLERQLGFLKVEASKKKWAEMNHEER